MRTELWDANTPAPESISSQVPYDAVLSNFGAINCITDLDQLGREAAQLLKPDSACAFVVMNRWCLFEVVLNLATLNFKNMTRRFRHQTVATLEDGSTLNITYHSAAEIKAGFGPGFKMESYTPIGVFLPPSELYGMFQKRPKLLRMAKALDGSLGKVWPFSRLADHFLIVLRREGT